ncbi:MAG: EamA family transporter [Cyclobacteriaceae bacterium]
MTNSRRIPWLIVASFATLYLVWGSTYLAVKYAVESFPPFLMCAARFIAAGSILYTFGLFQRWPRPTFTQWKYALLMGMLFMGSMSSVAWAEQYVDSSLAALIITSEPGLIVLLLWIFKRQPPSLQGLVGLVLGVAGMLVLVGPSLESLGESRSSAIIIIFLAALAWSVGSVYPAHNKLPSLPTQSIAMQMLISGVVLLGFSGITENWTTFSVSAVESVAWISWGFLVLFGSVLAFSAFNYLLRVESPDKVVTFAYVNPVIAVLLGWLFRGETLTMVTGMAALLLLTGVFLISTRRTLITFPTKWRRLAKKSA